MKRLCRLSGKVNIRPVSSYAAEQLSALLRDHLPSTVKVGKLTLRVRWPTLTVTPHEKTLLLTLSDWRVEWAEYSRLRVDFGGALAFKPLAVTLTCPWKYGPPMVPPDNVRPPREQGLQLEALPRSGPGRARLRGL